MGRCKPKTQMMPEDASRVQAAGAKNKESKTSETGFDKRAQSVADKTKETKKKEK